MMITAYDLENFGKAAAEKYLSDNTSLDNSISKLAEDKGLNKQQVSRIVEAANVETYLGLLKKADDKYVEFDVADSDNIFKAVIKVAGVDIPSMDYDNPPALDLGGDTNSGISDDTHEKTASIPESALRKLASECHWKHKFLCNSFEENEIDADSAVTDLYNQTKQAVLSGTSFADVENVIKVASPVLAEKISASLKESLFENMPHIDLDREAYNAFVEVDTPLYKSAEMIDKVAARRVELAHSIGFFSDKYGSLKDIKLPHLTKSASVEKFFIKMAASPQTIFQKLRGAFSKGVQAGGTKKKSLSFKFPVKTTLKAGAAGVAGAAIYQSGKNKGREQQGEILQKKLVDPRLLRRY